MKLKKLLKKWPNLEIKGPKEVEITGICSHSKRVFPGNLFIAKKGKTFDGNEYVSDAVEAGAGAIVTDIFNPAYSKVAQIIHPDPASLEGDLSALFYQQPSKELLMVGITGTNGKTTTSFMVKTLLDHLFPTCGLIGTIEYQIGAQRYQATHTTPDVSTNQKLLREMVKEGCSSAVMEVTSHALDQGRIDSVDFDVAVFTNLSLDHLDYHGTMEAYAAAKNKLFRGLRSDGVAIVNADSPWIETILAGCEAKVIRYGLEKEADLSVKQVKFKPDHTEALLSYKGDLIEAIIPVVGRFNLYNWLAAIAVGLSRRVSLKRCLEAMSDFTQIPGRLEKVPIGKNVYVDFAHTPDALKNVLQALSDFKQGRIICLFGCGGDRDTLKRPLMAKVAEEHADITIVTTDNPRSEEPEAIIQEILKGFSPGAEIYVEPDRRLAIEKALSIANEDDFILIAGKGHETYQIFAHATIPFDDRLVAKELYA